MTDTATLATATAGHYTVTLTDNGNGGYLTHTNSYDGAPYGDACAVNLEGEDPQEYVQRWAAALAR